MASQITVAEMVRQNDLGGTWSALQIARQAYLDGDYGTAEQYILIHYETHGDTPDIPGALAALLADALR